MRSSVCSPAAYGKDRSWVHRRVWQALPWSCQLWSRNGSCVYVSSIVHKEHVYGKVLVFKFVGLAVVAWKG